MCMMQRSDCGNGNAVTGMLVKSKAGHDKDSIYVILREEEAYVYLVDGRIRTVDKPKKKNRKHVQIIKKPRMEIGEKAWENSEVRRIIKEYERA